MTCALVNARLGASQDEGLAVLLAGGKIAGLVPLAELPEGTRRIDLQGRRLAAGFIDTQVNGGGGVLFNDEPTVEGIEAIGRAHRRFGTTGFLPTLISDDFSVIRRAIAAVDQAIEAGVPGVLGIHIEGPFLNPARKGIHDAEKMRALDAEGFEILTSLKRGRTLVTLAPEVVEPGVVTRLEAAGVIVAAGHTNASYETATRAFAEGLTGVTHLFNAMSPIASRAPGVVGAALSDPRSWCGIIVDGQHVDPVVLRLALRCRPAERFILVTDAMPCVGSDLRTFTLQDKIIHVRDGACFDDRGRLAGSNLDMSGAVRNAVQLLGVGLDTASRMASANPAEFLGLGAELGRIAPGYRADLVLLGDDLTVRGTWIGGEMDQDALSVRAG